MPRSGGFSTVDVGQIHEGTWLLNDALMFGGGSAWTAGDINKVTTLAVMLLAVVAKARGDPDVEAYGRRIPREALQVAIAVSLVSGTIVLGASLALLAITGWTLDVVLFEVISAVATCGLSTGVTAGQSCMANRVRTVVLTDDQRAALRRMVRANGSPARVVERARIVLLSAQGVPGVQIAERVGCSEPTVIRWRSRFAQHGLAGLADAPRSGKPATIPQAVRDEILAITLTEPPCELGIAHWSSRLLADRLRREGKAVSHATVARVWKHFGIQPHRSGTFKFSTDPELEAKVRDVVGLYLNPPDKAVVLCVASRSALP